MNVIIKYSLSDAGRKANIMAGGDGKEHQCLEVGPDATEFAACLDAAKFNGDTPFMDRDGNCYIGGTYHQFPKWDRIPTPADFLAQDAALTADRAAKTAAEAKEKTDATLAVLTARKTKSRNETIAATVDGMTGSANYSCLSPDWPYYQDATVIQSPEAVAWVAEIDAGNESARLAAVPLAEANAREKIAAKIAADDAARVEKEKRLALRAERGCRDGDESFNIEDGALTRVPMWESHSRGKNWLAIIGVDPSKPGGLDRDFAAKAKGESYYLVPNWSVGDAVEFGADYYSGRGSKNSKRWYGYVVKITSDYVILHEEAGGKTAVKAGLKYRESQPVTIDSPAEDQIAAAIAHVNGEGRIVANEPSVN